MVITQTVIILQAGHYNRTTGATGAPGEKDFNWDVANRVAAELVKYGKSVRVVRADPPKTDITGDFELFLAIHYDADIYGKGGYLVDFCDPLTDSVTVESQRIARCLESEYGAVTGIVDHPERTNINTRKYYMWNLLSPKTPCVLIECGVGQHRPDDYEILFNKRELVVSGIVRGLLKAFNIQENDMTDVQKRILDFIGNRTEGDVRAAFGALADMPSKEGQIQTLQTRVLDLENSQKSLEDRIAALESTIQADLKSIADWQTAAESANKALENANKTNQELAADRNTWKARYETALKDQVNKYSGWQLIRLGVNKLIVKK